MSTRETRRRKMLFGVNLVLHLRGLLLKIDSPPPSFCLVKLVWGGVRIVYDLPLPLISL